MGLAAAGERAPARAASRDAGDIVVLEDADGVVSRRNAFDLDRRTVRFEPTAAGASRYRFSVSDGGYDDAAAGAGTVIEGLGDDDTRRFNLPFPFPFFGQTYHAIFVNSDGNLTFGAGDTELDRSLGRMTAGPPRIAPLFRDLDPGRALDGLRVLVQPTRFTVSWVSVPEYSSFGTGPLQTFQVRLFADGRIELAYNGITTSTAVVGIAPGGLAGATAVVSFSEGSNEEFTAAIVERFTSLREVDIVLAAQKFYETHDDAYDYLIIYNDLGVAAAPGAIAYEVTVRNHRSGYGDRQVDVGAEFGSPSRLQAVLNMGPLSQYPVDPDAAVPGRAVAGDTPLTILAHEAGHLFLAYASIRDPNRPEARPMLGRQRAHWNFSFNSEASLLEGNRICDRERTPDQCPPAPPSGRFVTTATVEGYSPLDQYLMGFRPWWEVPDTFLVENSTAGDPSRQPQAGVAFDGQRRDIRIEEIIDAEGRRTPDYRVSQRRFRFAFLLIVAAGSEPSAAALEQIDRYRREFEEFYHQASGGRAWAETRLERALHLSAFPAAGLLLGSAGRATISIEHPAAGRLDVLLSSREGAVQIPAGVTIPAGETTASVPMTGVRAGVDEITAEIPGSLYQRATAKIEVLASASALRLVAVSGDKQVAVAGQPLPEPVVVRATDVNELPFPGLRLSARASGSGTVVPGEATTDVSGQASFTWTPGPGPVNELMVTVAGMADGPTLTVSTTGAPVFAAGGVVNAASFAAPVCPGALATLFGVNLAAGATAVADLPPPTELAGVRVLVNGNPAQLLYVSDRQINFVVPPSVAPGTASLVVSTPLGMTPVVPIPLAEVSPGVFVLPQTGLGAVVVAGTGKTTAERPAAAGEFLEIYCTGLGPVQPLAANPELSETVLKPRVSIAGTPAQIQFSGLAPGWFGLNQVNVRVPAGLPSGRQELSLSIGEREANEVLIEVR